MLKKLGFLLFLWAFMCAAYANKIDSSYVLLTNNTNEKLTITPALTTTDHTFKRGKDWDGYLLTLAPYETKQVLWFNRLRSLKPNILYRFDLRANLPPYSDQQILITFLAKRESGITTELTLPRQFPQTIFKNNSFNQSWGEFWGSQHTIYGRTLLPLPNIYKSFHFVIDAPAKIALETATNQQISVLTYNTQLMPFYAGIVDDLNQPEFRAQDIPQKITKYDVVILEELFDRHLRNTIVRLMQLNYPYHSNVVGQHTSKVLTGGVMIFSKWPILKEDQIVYRAGAGMDKLAAKGAVYVAINKRGKIFHLIGTHLQAGHHQKSMYARQRQLHELADFINDLRVPANEPLLMGGDFNIDQLTEEIEILLCSLHVSIIANIGYPYSVDHTINTMMVNKSRSRLDYIFYSNNHAKPKTAFNNVFVHRDLNREKMWPKFDLSDHFPLESYFDFSE